MTEQAIYWLRNEDLRVQAVSEVMRAPLGFVVTVRRPARSLEQSEKFHAHCSDLAASSVEWAGQRRTKDEWKFLLVSAWCIATGRSGELITGIEGEKLYLRPSTTSLSVHEMGELIDYADAFCAQHGVNPRRPAAVT